MSLSSFPQPKKRVPRASSTVNIEERGVPNNGDIIVLPPPERAPPEEYEEMTVNRIRYQVPEQNIILDFWGKVVPPSRRGELGKKAKKRASPRKKRAMGNGYESGNSSPLTDLTSSEDEDMEMADRRGSSRKREGSNIASATTSALDNLALLAEVRYIDMLNNPSPQPSTSSVSDRKASVSSTTRNGPRPSLPLPSSSSAAPSAPAATSSSASNPRFSLGAIPPFSGNASTGQAASPTTSSIPLSASTSATGGRHGSPSLSPAPGSARAAPPQSELTVQSKEDLKALMQVRKLLLSQGQAPGSAKTTMLSFLEGAPIIVSLSLSSCPLHSSLTKLTSMLSNLLHSRSSLSSTMAKLVLGNDHGTRRKMDLDLVDQLNLLHRAHRPFLRIHQNPLLLLLFPTRPLPIRSPSLSRQNQQPRLHHQRSKSNPSVTSLVNPNDLLHHFHKQPLILPTTGPLLRQSD